MGTPRHRSTVVHSEPVTTFLSQEITYDRHLDSRVMDDVITSDYSRRSTDGEILINPLEFVVNRHVLPDDTINWTETSTGDSFSVPDSATANVLRSTIGYLPQTENLYVPSTTIDEDEELDLRRQLALAFVDKPQYGFGEDLFEIAETIRFLKNPFNSIIKLLRAFDLKASGRLSKMDHIRDFARKSEAVAEVWASYSFALAPLVRSIENALDALHDTSTLSLRRTSRSKNTIGVSNSADFVGSFWGGQGLPLFGANATATRTQSIEFHAGIVYDAPQRGYLIDKLGLRNKDLIVTAWEVIPMSFMLDRIVSVKNVLSSSINLLDPTVSIKGGFVTKRKTERYSVLQTDFGFTRDGHVLNTFAAQPHVTEKFTMTREKWDPSIADSLPLFNPKELVNSATKMADLASLLTLQIVPLIRKYYTYV